MGSVDTRDLISTMILVGGSFGAMYIKCGYQKAGHSSSGHMGIWVGCLIVADTINEDIFVLPHSFSTIFFSKQWSSTSYGAGSRN